MASQRDSGGVQRGVERRSVIALGSLAAGAGLVAALARPGVGNPAAAAPAEGPREDADDGTRLTAHRAAYFRRARF